MKAKRAQESWLRFLGPLLLLAGVTASAGFGCAGTGERDRPGNPTCSALNRECVRGCREHRGGLEERRRPDEPYVRSTRLNQCETRCGNQLAACRKRDS